MKVKWLELSQRTFKEFREDNVLRALEQHLPTILSSHLAHCDLVMGVRHKGGKRGRRVSITFRTAENGRAGISG